MPDKPGLADDVPDLVTRLRAYALGVDDANSEIPERVLRGAADEIEALRRVIRIGRIQLESVEPEGRG